MKRYPEYKESAVEWIGEIPVHWEIGQIKHIATLISQKSTPETDAIKISPENVEPKTGKVLDFYSPHDSVGVKFQAGDVLFNKLRVYLSKVIFAEYSGYSLGEMIVVRPSLQDTAKYVFYLMLSPRFIEYCDSMSYGVKMPRTSVDDILNAQIPLASYQEQIQIVNFLDRKTKQIDELIRIKARRVELLQEQRTVLINQTVTKGLDPNAEMKPSGVGYIGDIPKDWEVKKIKYTQSNLIGGVWGSEPAGNENDIYCIRVADFNYVQLAISTHNLTLRNISFKERGKRILKTGDLLIEKSGGGEKTPVGKTVMFDVEIPRPSVTSNFISKFTVNSDSCFPRYLLYCFDFLYQIGLTRKHIKQTTGIQNLDIDSYFQERIPFPSLIEQIQIADFLDHKTAQIDELRSNEQRSVELLKEYRQTLISEVVTGKIDIRSEV